MAKAWGGKGMGCSPKAAALRCEPRPTVQSLAVQWPSSAPFPLERGILGPLPPAGWPPTARAAESADAKSTILYPKSNSRVSLPPRRASAPRAQVVLS